MLTTAVRIRCAVDHGLLVWSPASVGGIAKGGNLAETSVWSALSLDSLLTSDAADPVRTAACCTTPDQAIRLAAVMSRLGE